MDAAARIKQLMDEKGWSMYMLSKQAGLASTTLQTMFARNTVPSLTTIEAVCQALGIPLAQFFAEGEVTVLTEQQREYLECFSLLSPESQSVLLRLMKQMK